MEPRKPMKSLHKRIGKGKSVITAFTLVELIVVITILAILATIGFLALSGYSQDAKDSAIKANIRSVVSAIASESAITGNSPRYYVIHDTWAALSGAFAYVDGPVALTGGAWDVSGANYSAGNPDWTKLKLNPEKFKLSALVKTLSAAFGTATAYDAAGQLSVGAMDYSPSATSTGRKRSSSYFQVTGANPVTKTVSVNGNFPVPTDAQASAWAARGLVKSPAGTGALADGEYASWGSSSGGGAAAFVPGNAYASGQSFTYALPSGTTVTVNVLGTGIWSVSGTKSLHSPACDTDDIAIWGASWNPQIWAACNVGATTAMPFSDMKFDGTTYDAGVSTSTSAGGIFQWGNNTDVRSAGTWSSPTVTSDSWGNTINTNNARKGPCPTGYHVPNGWMDSAGSTYTAANNEWNTAYLAATSAGAGTSCDPATITNQHRRVRCLLRLPRSGGRDSVSGSWFTQGLNGYYWSSSPSGANAKSAYFDAPSGNISSNDYRAGWYSVRCLKN